MLAAPSSIIKLDSFSSIREFSTGDSLASSKFTVLTDVFQDGTVNSNREITTTASSDFEEGEAVLIQIDGYSFKHIIANVGDSNNYILKDEIQDKNNSDVSSGACKIKRLVRKRVQLNSLDEGYYIIEPINKKLVIRDNYVNPYVSLEDLSTKLLDVTNLEEYRLRALNELGLKIIFSDLSGFDNYFDIIDEIDLYMLLFYQVQCLLTSDFETKSENNNCSEYKRRIQSYRVKDKLDVNSDGTIASNIPQSFSSGGWSL